MIPPLLLNCSKQLPNIFANKTLNISKLNDMPLLMKINFNLSKADKLLIQNTFFGTGSTNNPRLSQQGTLCHKLRSTWIKGQKKQFWCQFWKNLKKKLNFKKNWKKIYKKESVKKFQQISFMFKHKIIKIIFDSLTINLTKLIKILTNMNNKSEANVHEILNLENPKKSSKSSLMFFDW